MPHRIFIASNLTELLVLFTALQNIVTLSITVTVRASVKSTNAACPHNGTCNHCIFAIFSKTGFFGHSIFVLQTIDSQNKVSKWAEFNNALYT